MLILKDGRVTYKRLKGRRMLKFYHESWDSFYQVKNRQFVIIGLFSNNLDNDHKKEITYVCRCKDDTCDFTNVYHIRLSWRRLKKRLIADYTSRNYERFY